MKGKYYKDKETGRFKKYTFNQQSLTEEYQKGYNGDKENEDTEIEDKQEEKKENNTQNTLNNQRETDEKDKNKYQYISDKKEAVNYLTNKLNLSNNELDEIKDLDIINRINETIINTKNIKINQIKVESMNNKKLAAMGNKGTLFLNKKCFSNRKKLESYIQTPEKVAKMKEEYKKYISKLENSISDLREKLKYETNNYEKYKINKDIDKYIKQKDKAEEDLTSLNYRYTVNYDYTIKGKIEQTINHELGHNLFNNYFQKNKVSKMFVYNLFSKYKYEKENKKYIEENISEYAAADYKEFFAECYSMYRNDNERKKLDKDIINIIEEIIK